MHNILYRIFDENVSRSTIIGYVRDVVAHSGDRYGTDNVEFYTPSQPLVNRAAAEEWIRSHDNGFYKGIAVRFYDHSKCKKTKKIETLEQRIADNQHKATEFIKAHSVKTFKAAYIGCPCCGSRLNREKLHGEKCPLCYEDLRAKSTLERIEGFKKKEKELRAQLEEEKQKDKKNVSVKWLVKFEYHS